jgi:hypothetical protein
MACASIVTVPPSPSSLVPFACTAPAIRTFPTASRSTRPAGAPLESMSASLRTMTSPTVASTPMEPPDPTCGVPKSALPPSSVTLAALTSIEPPCTSKVPRCFSTRSRPAKSRVEPATMQNDRVTTHVPGPGQI